MLLTIFYLISRGWKLLAFPPFIDELLYIRWTDTIASNWKSVWVTVLEDGQPPLYFWLAAITKSITHLDTLLILRSLSIVAGLISLLLLINLGTKLFNRQIGIILGITYTLFPMFLWYDRLGMRESMITLAGLIMIYGLIDRLVYGIEKGSYLVVLGFFLGIATKGTAIIFLPVIFVSYLLHYRHFKLGKSDVLSALLIGSVLVMLYFGAHSVISKGETFLLTLADIRSRIYPNLYSTIRWILEYSTLPILLLGLWGIVLLYFRKSKTNLLLLTILSVTIIIEIVTAKIYFPRYFLWALIAWLIPISYGASWLTRKRFGWVMLGLLITPIIIFDYQIILNPSDSPLPAIERWQYVSGWPSGHGIKAMAEEVQKHQVDVLVVEENEVCKTGIPYYGSSDFVIVSIKNLEEVIKSVEARKQVYLCLNVENDFGWSGVSTQIAKVDRPGGQSSLRLYKLEGENNGAN